MDDIETSNPMDHLYPDAFSDAYKQAETLLEKMTEFDLLGMAGALVGEMVNRGNDTDTALESILEAAKGGAAGSRAFDQMVP